MATEPERVELPVVAKPFGSTSVFVERMDFDLVFVTLGNRMEEGWCEAFRVVDALRQTHFEPILNAKANQLKKEAENATSRVYWWDNVLYELGFYRRCDRVEESTVNLPRLLDQVLRVLEEAKEIATAKGVGTTEASLSDLSKQIHEARKTQHEVLKFRSELGLALQEYRGTLSFRLGTIHWEMDKDDSLTRYQKSIVYVLVVFGNLMMVVLLFLSLRSATRKVKPS